MKPKKILKKIRSSEPTVSTFMGIFVVLAVGFLILKFFQGSKKQPEIKLLEAEPTKIEEEEAEISRTEKGEEISSPKPLIQLPTTHTIEKGDNLWQIAEKYYGSGFNWVDIAKENQIKNPDRIEIGLKLAISSTRVRVPVEKIALAKEAISPILGEKYQVIRGDNLWKICLRAYGDGYRWVQVAKTNDLKNPGLIHPGNTLTLSR